ncbi:outer membrane lipid asymmetry maintenance protein MlaD [Allofrancisella guangzhouensis]|uniref:ABC transporter substrate-binding protein n=1 Tax=Allofrancisella guangzhouensis TaxID=594679 RepID=A0A0A8E2P7_9GAMM|nr:outer membrane lipid asymmetry maintenance protein MlaD [Allofrancisella guangzhouensis]AJC48268.1 ABC transporter substrate-binding protein [Allofrancisella guangzhouensis]MBK2027504.1 outer membrane lipid asymmetry maintenance protein MlaD [Allofrancisella guangzhouensis]MBK2044387.1 outer membrane lipid asymmetry maintenance protein MlaD [Allofrancisella guangzhouensis]MBK2045427.1 outer membrane lipid asymmetry maintenance protein MlaD [Allofrancisella guangzhouensis]
MRNKYFETSVGIFIILGVLCLVFLIFKVSGSSFKSFNTNHYSIQAQFKNVGSLRINAAVKIAGVEVGQVTNISLEKTYNGFMALVTISMNDSEKIPANYSAAIAMSGVLGDNYIALSPPKEDIMAVADLTGNSASEDKYLHQGSIIPLENTESAIDLGSLINTFVANKNTEDSK